MRVANIDTGEGSMAVFLNVDRRSNSEYTSNALLFSVNNGHYMLHQVRFAGDPHAHDIEHETEIVQPVLLE